MLARVRPLVPRDNDSSLRGLAPQYAVTAEVLHGLELIDAPTAARFTFERSGGGRTEVVLEPIPAATYVSAFADPLHGHFPAALPARARPLYLANADRALWLTRMARGRALYVGYNSALASTYELSRRLQRVARDPLVKRVIVDVRLNGGGDNTTYGPLLGALQSPQVNRSGKLFLLVGRATFSAAGNFATEVRRDTRATVVGEPTGGGINQYGDATTFRLPTLGWNVYVPTTYQQFAAARDRRLAIVPDVRVALSSADFFAGRDPVLQAALEGAR